MGTTYRCPEEGADDDGSFLDLHKTDRYDQDHQHAGDHDEGAPRSLKGQVARGKFSAAQQDE